MMNADPRVTFVADRTIAARKQERRTLHYYCYDFVDTLVQPRSQFEAGVNDGMNDNPRRVGLVGIFCDFPALAKAAYQTLEIGFIPHGTRPPERPLDSTC